MPIYRGKLKVIGAGTWKNGTTSASVLEIGSSILQRVKYPDLLKTYLDISLGREIAIIATTPGVICAVKIGDTIYKDGGASFNIILGIVMIVFGIPLLAVFFAGALLIFPGMQFLAIGLTLKNNLPKLEAMELP